VYKVFLVEDEVIVREGIRNNIFWEQAHYTLAGEASDGEIALSMILDIKPDILITDIRMPFMDGLTLSKIVKKTLPWIKIIILSGHDEFEYAREAVSLGIDEYLLKPVSSSEMKSALEKIAARIDEDKEMFNNIKKLEAQIGFQTDILRDRWLSDFIDGKISAAKFIEQEKEFGLDLIARSYIVLVAELINNNEKEQQFIQAKIIAQSIIREYADCIYFWKNEKSFVIIIKEMVATNEESLASLKESAYAIAQALKYELERNTKYSLVIGIGNTVLRTGEIAASYSMARKIIEHGITKGVSHIVDADTFNNNNSSLPSSSFNPSPLANVTGDIFLTKLKYAAKKDVDSIMQEYTKVLGDNFNDNQLLIIFIFGEIIVAGSKIVEALGGDIASVAPFSLNQESIQVITGSKEIFDEKVKAFLFAVIEYRDSRTSGRYQSVIVKTKKYIDENYSSADLSLYSTAFYVGISPNHLSTVFSQETGEKFIEYLTRVRIEKAKELLRSTTMKSADITYEVGFSDPHYFSSIFKKNTGLSPREYRSLENRKESP
jgi:two-component system response regulator YesN